MKKILITLFIFFVALLGMVILIKNISNPLTPKSSNQKENTFSSLNNELSITLPSDFQVSTSLGIKDKYEPKSIFVATSSEDFLSIKIMDADEPLNQNEFVQLLYEEIVPNEVTQIGSEKIVWGEPYKANFGQNYYAYHDGIRYSTFENQPIQENIRQYMTSYGDKGYIIDFINYFPNPNKATYWDQIVSSISFN